VLVLHEAFELTHAEIGDVLDISEEGARQHLRRARAHLGGEPKRTRAAPAVHDMCIDRFLDALVRGDLSAVQDLLATDVVSYSDGGGKVRAARRRVIGAHRVEYFFASLRRRQAVRDVKMIEINGRRAAVLWFGQHQQVLALHVAEGKITEIYSIRNPDKLHYLEQQLGHDGPPSVPGAA
jgi:RNA polymerase sigma-70 factor (ECF subfamily)